MTNRRYWAWAVVWTLWAFGLVAIAQEPPVEDPPPAPAVDTTAEPVVEDPAIMPPAEGEPVADEGDAAEAPAEPDSGDYFGNALGGNFGGAPWSPAVPGLVTTPGALGPGRVGGVGFQAGRRNRRFEISGSGQLGLNLRSVSGQTETFRNDQYGRNQTFTEQASLLLSGPIWKWANINLHAQFDHRSYGYNDVKPIWRLFWEDQNNRVSLGDINPTFDRGNSFVQFSRRLRGLMAEGRIANRVDYMAFGSLVQGSIRNETIVGNGTPGPYYLTYTPLVDGSAIVLLDGVVQQPGYGDTGDYTLNPSTGELNFSGTRIITPANRIEVRYETMSRSGPSDLLLGARVAGAVMRNLQVGASYMAQMSGAKTNNEPVEKRVTDQLTVPTPSAGPFTLRPRPILAGSESVTVNGQLQVRDSDYEINYTTGELRFFQLLPEGTNIVVRFSVRETLDMGSGDRSLLGLDAYWGLGEKLALQFEMALSTGQPSTRANPFSLGGYGGTSSWGGGGYGGYGGYGSSGYGFDTGYGSGGYTSGYGGSYGGSTWGSGSIGGSTWGTGSYGGSGYGGYNTGTGGIGGSFGSGWRGRQTDAEDDGTQQPSGSGGAAYRMSAATRWGHFQANAEFKSISDNFARIDSTSFYQNERGWSINTSYTPGSQFQLTAAASGTSRPFTSYSTVGGAQLATRSRVSSQQQVLSAAWRPGTRTNLQFLFNRQSNGGGGYGNSVWRAGLNGSHSLGRMLAFTAGLDYTSSGSAGSTSSTGVVQNLDTTSILGRAGVTFSTNGGRLSSRLDYSFANSQSTTTRNSASNIIGSLQWQILDRLSLQISHQLSDARNTSRIGRPTATEPQTTPDPAPTPGTAPRYWWDRAWHEGRQVPIPGTQQPTVPGIAVDPLTGLPLGASQSLTNKNQSTSVMLMYQPINTVSISASWNRSVSATGRLASSNSDSWQSNIHWQPSQAMGFGLGFNRQSMRYTETGDSTNTSILNANFDWRLSQFLDLRADFQLMNTGNHFRATEEGQTGGAYGLSPKSSFNSFGLDLRYQIRGSRYSTFASFRRDSASGGLQNYSRLGFQTGIDMRITDIITGRVGYEFTNYGNRGAEQSGYGGSYTAHLLNATIGARF